MAISNEVLTNRLDKKVDYGVARTAPHGLGAGQKTPIAEAIPSPFPNPAHNLWINSDLIPNAANGDQPPTVNTTNVKVYKPNVGQTVEGVLELTRDPTILDHRTWLCSSTPGDGYSTRLQDWIRISYGGGYLPKFRVGPRGYNSGSGLGSGNHVLSTTDYPKIFDNSSGKEFYFDYEAGLLVFAGTSLPSNVDDTDYSVYMEQGYRYVGIQGLKNYTSGGGGGGSTTYSFPSVGELNDPTTNVLVANVSSILFDVDSGFALTDNANGAVTVAMESTFKHWNVFANTDTAVSSNIIAQAVDTISLYGGNGIVLTANTGGIKSLTVDVDQGSLTLQGNTASDLLNWDNQTNKPSWSANSSHLYYSDLFANSASSVIKDLNVLATRIADGTETPQPTSTLRYFANGSWSMGTASLGLGDLHDSLVSGSQDGQVLQYVVTDGSGTWKNQAVDYSSILNRPTHTSNLTNDGVGTGSSFVTASGLINTIKLGDLANVANGASDNNIANSYILAFLSDTNSWTPIAANTTSSGALTTLSGTDVLDLLTPVDGAGSALDSDKLDGQQGSYYTTGSNINYSGASISLGSGDLNSASGKIAVGNTTPSVPLQVEHLGFDTATVFNASASAVMVDEWDGQKFRAAKYFITVTDLDTNDDGSGSDPSFLAVEAMMVHNGSLASITVYGEVTAGDGAVTDASFSANYDTNTNTCRLNVTTTTDNCTIKASRMSLTS